MRELRELFRPKLREIIPLLAQECNVNHFSVIRWFYTNRRPARRYFLKLPSIVLEAPIFSENEKKRIIDGLMQLYSKYYKIKGKKNEGINGTIQKQKNGNHP